MYSLGRTMQGPGAPTATVPVGTLPMTLQRPCLGGVRSRRHPKGLPQTCRGASGALRRPYHQVQEPPPHMEVVLQYRIKGEARAAAVHLLETCWSTWCPRSPRRPWGCPVRTRAVTRAGPGPGHARRPWNPGGGPSRGLLPPWLRRKPRPAAPVSGRSRPRRGPRFPRGSRRASWQSQTRRGALVWPLA